MAEDNGKMDGTQATSQSNGDGGPSESTVSEDVSELQEQIAELEGALAAIEGYVGHVEQIDDTLERQMEAQQDIINQLQETVRSNEHRLEEIAGLVDEDGLITQKEDHRVEPSYKRQTSVPTAKSSIADQVGHCDGVHDGHEQSDRRERTQHGGSRDGGHSDDRTYTARHGVDTGSDTRPNPMQKTGAPEGHPQSTTTGVRSAWVDAGTQNQAAAHEPDSARSRNVEPPQSQDAEPHHRQSTGRSQHESTPVDESPPHDRGQPGATESARRHSNDTSLVDQIITDARQAWQRVTDQSNP